MAKNKRRVYYRDARGRFTTKPKAIRRAIGKAERRPTLPPRARPRYTREEESLLADLRKDLRGTLLPAGTEFELTATTKGGTPRRRSGGSHHKRKLRR
jgi:hypothetical protein